MNNIKYIFYRRSCQFCMRTKIAAHIFGAEVKFVELERDISRSLGIDMVPCAVLEGGKYMFESLDIINHLANGRDAIFPHDFKHSHIVSVLRENSDYHPDMEQVFTDIYPQDLQTPSLAREVEILPLISLRPSLVRESAFLQQYYAKYSYLLQDKPGSVFTLREKDTDGET